MLIQLSNRQSAFSWVLLDQSGCQPIVHLVEGESINISLQYSHQPIMLFWGQFGTLEADLLEVPPSPLGFRTHLSGTAPACASWDSRCYSSSPATWISCTTYTSTSHSHGCRTTLWSFKFITRTHTRPASTLYNVQPTTIPSCWRVSCTTTVTLCNLWLVQVRGITTSCLASTLTSRKGGTLKQSTNLVNIDRLVLGKKTLP